MSNDQLKIRFLTETLLFACAFDRIIILIIFLKFKLMTKKIFNVDDVSYDKITSQVTKITCYVAAMIFYVAKITLMWPR